MSHRIGSINHLFGGRQARGLGVGGGCFESPIGSGWPFSARIRPGDERPRPQSSPPPVGFPDSRRRCRSANGTAQTRPSWGYPASSNGPRCGGARHGGHLGASGSDASASRWARIFLITTGSPMQVTIRTAPLQADGSRYRCQRPVSNAAPRSSRRGVRLARRLRIHCRGMLA
jgi:hypothetical protein